jgi:hypothetical protein
MTAFDPTTLAISRLRAQNPRVIDLEPFGGYSRVRNLPAHVKTPSLFWHSDGDNYKNFASQFSAIVKRTAKWAREHGIAFQPFPFPRPAPLPCDRVAQIWAFDL